VQQNIEKIKVTSKLNELEIEKKDKNNLSAKLKLEDIKLQL